MRRSANAPRRQLLAGASCNADADAGAFDQTMRAVLGRSTPTPPRRVAISSPRRRGSFQLQLARQDPGDPVGRRQGLRELDALQTA